MKLVQLVHNPGAGDEKFTWDELLAFLEVSGYECRYFSTKNKGWADFDRHADILAVAGGDGTVRKVASKIINGELKSRPGHLSILPLGTANNISQALGIGSDPRNTIRSWREGRTFSFDVGRVSGVAGHSFFLESFGYGVFPALMIEMEKENQAQMSAEERIDKALEVLHRLVLAYEPRQCRLGIDGMNHSGSFLLAEVMNTPTIGPNLGLSPCSDPGDGELEIALVHADEREAFADYIAAMRKGAEEPMPCPLLKGSNISIQWNGTHAHVDDQVVDLANNTEIEIRLEKGLLKFLVPGDKK